MNRDELQRLLDAFNSGNREALSLLINCLSDRFAALMATILHRDFDRLSKDDQAIGTATLAQKVHLKIANGIVPGKLNGVDHLMRIAARNARWFLLDEIRKRKRMADKAKASRRAINDSAAKFWLLMEQFLDWLPEKRVREFYKAVPECTQSLGEHLKDVFDRRFFASNRDVAEELGIPANTARGRWDMAIIALERCLLKKFPPPMGKAPS